MQFTKDDDCSWWRLLESCSLPHLHSSSSTFSTFISFDCLWVSILANPRYFYFLAISYSVSSALIPVVSVILWVFLTALRYPDCYWLGWTWAAHLRVNLYQQLFFPLVMLLQLQYKFLEIFYNTVYDPLSKLFRFPFTKLSKSSPQATLPYSYGLTVSPSQFIVFPT